MNDKNVTPKPTKESAKDYEAHKTSEQRAEDVAYTINHALACTLTDFIDPYVGNWTQEYLGKRISIGCGHDHSDGHVHGPDCDHKHVISLPQIGGGNHDDHGHVHGPGCNHHKPGNFTCTSVGHDHDHDGHQHHGTDPLPPVDTHTHDHAHDHASHDHAHCPVAPKSHLKQWIIGEFVGDFGAVPVTIAFQRYAPDFMEKLRNVVEPVLGGAFRMGARFSARSWASENNMAPDSKAVKDKENAIYEHEVRHLPQAVVWTASSIALNLATQRYLGNTAPLAHLAAAKATGATISAALVVTGRAFAPQSARKWDQYTSKNIFLPLTKVVGGAAGITSEDVDRMAAKEGLTESNWTDKVKQDQPTPGKTLG
jgi:hypothetical protein